MTPSNHRRQPTILLVEDNPDDIFFIEAALKARQSRLHVVNDGAEALKFLRRQAPYERAPRPSLILLDLNLPKISGLEVLEAIKADKDFRPIPVVVLTTSDSEKDAAASYDQLATSFITKPDDLDEFTRVVERIEQFWLEVAQLPPPQR